MQNQSTNEINTRTCDTTLTFRDQWVATSREILSQMDYYQS